MTEFLFSHAMNAMNLSGISKILLQPLNILLSVSFIPPGGCIDINECLVDNGGCHDVANCFNVPGSRNCACIRGYLGNGVGDWGCVDFNECDILNGGKLKLHGGGWINKLE